MIHFFKACKFSTVFAEKNSPRNWGEGGGVREGVLSNAVLTWVGGDFALPLCRLEKATF